MGKSSISPPLPPPLLLLQPIMSLSPPPPLLQPPPSSFHSESFNLDSKISPSILLIIVILAIIFFISGLLHLLVRLLLRPTHHLRHPDDELLDHVTVLQGQLQQLFHLHDSGVDQSYIDTLPLFYYKAIIGLKDPFDCAVCLCEFEPNDKLRLLPKCSHAFHMDCIDTWLLSHSTCPLCRSSLLSDYGAPNHHHHGCSSSIVCVLESGSVENSREIINERVSVSVSGSNRHPGDHLQGEFGSGRVEFPRKSCESNNNNNKHGEEKIVAVKLGKFRNVDVGEGSSENDHSNNTTTSNSNNNISGGNDDLGSRRCYSMGSFAYVLDETNSLQVPIRDKTPMKKQSRKNKASNNKAAGHRAVRSEYGCDSQREFNGIEAFKTIDNNINNNNNLQNGRSSKRRDGFSISRIWESWRRSSSELDVSELVGGGGGDEETQSCYSVDSNAYPTTTSNTSASNRRTLLWLMGRQNKIVHNHSTSLSSSMV